MRKDKILKKIHKFSHDADIFFCKLALYYVSQLNDSK